MTPLNNQPEYGHMEHNHQIDLPKVKKLAKKLREYESDNQPKSTKQPLPGHSEKEVNSMSNQELRNEIKIILNNPLLRIDKPGSSPHHVVDADVDAILALFTTQSKAQTSAEIARVLEQIEAEVIGEDDEYYPPAETYAEQEHKVARNNFRAEQRKALADVRTIIGGMK